MSARALWKASFVLSIVLMIAGLVYTFGLPGEEKSMVPTYLAVPLAIIARISLGQMRKHGR